MFAPYTRGLRHSTLLISGPAIWLDSRWDENFTHISRRWLSSISAFSYAPHRHFQQRFLSSKTEVIVKKKKKVYLCLLSFFHRILLLSLQFVLGSSEQAKKKQTFWGGKCQINSTRSLQSVYKFRNETFLLTLTLWAV